jgi:mRNA interferase MazF
MVLSPRSYNGKIGLALFCPVTSQIKGYPFEVHLSEQARVKGVVLADQIKSLEWRARRARFIEKSSETSFNSVLDRVEAVLSME